MPFTVDRGRVSGGFGSSCGMTSVTAWLEDPLGAREVHAELRIKPRPHIFAAQFIVTLGSALFARGQGLEFGIDTFGQFSRFEDDLLVAGFDLGPDFRRQMSHMLMNHWRMHESRRDSHDARQ